MNPARVDAMKRATPLSLREYAKRRGVSAMAVSRAVKSGRLTQSVVRDEGGDPKIADPELADREWEAATDLSRAPGYVKERADARRPEDAGFPPPPPTSERVEGEVGGLAEETAREKHWKANLAELEFREREGQLVEAKLVEDQLATVFAQCRTKLLAVPSRARQSLPHLTAGDIAILEDLQREALQDLVSPDEGHAPKAQLPPLVSPGPGGEP